MVCSNQNNEPIVFLPDTEMEGCSFVSIDCKPSEPTTTISVYLFTEVASDPWPLVVRVPWYKRLWKRILEGRAGK